ncbi:MAG: DMT family transporter [Pseudomonadota bacterium]
MPHQRPLLHWLMLGALVAMWGSSFLFTKIAVDALDPGTIVFARLGIGAGLLLAVVLVLGKRFPKSWRAWGFFLAMAVMGNALPFFLITWGQQGIDSGVAGILMAIMPLSTLVLAHFLVAGERLTPLRGLGFLVGFGGIVVLIGPDTLLKLEGEGGALLSQLSVLGGALCYAVNTIIARRRPASDHTAAAAGVMLLAFALSVPVLGPELSLPGELPLGAALAVGALGLFSTALATVVYLNLIMLAGPSFVALLNYLIPLWAVLLGMLLLGERPGWSALLALALVLGGIGLSELGRPKR